MQKKRYFLFYAFTLLFFIAAPILAAFALGYTIDFSHISIEKTGGIFLKLTRRGAIAISLDGSPTRETSFLSRGALLTKIPRGTHLVRVEQEGHHPWFKSVLVTEAEVRELRNILLVPMPIQYATSSDAEISSLLTPLAPLTFPHLDAQKNLVSLENDNSHIIASHINSFGAVSAGFLMVDKNGFLSLAKGEKIDVIARPGFYLSKDAPIRFFESPSGEVAILDDSGGLFLLLSDFTLHVVDGGVKNVAFDSLGKKLLIQKDQSLEIVWREENKNQPFQKVGTREKILALHILDETILDADWYFGDDAHIVVRTKNGVYITEIDGRGGRNTAELMSAPVDEIITTVKDSKAIFFRQESGIYRINF